MYVRTYDYTYSTYLPTSTRIHDVGGGRKTRAEAPAAAAGGLESVSRWGRLATDDRAGRGDTGLARLLRLDDTYHIRIPRGCCRAGSLECLSDSESPDLGHSRLLALHHPLGYRRTNRRGNPGSPPTSSRPQGLTPAAAPPPPPAPSGLLLAALL